MPIKLNLLAEAQAAEELRRKDPVKRAIGVGALLIFAMLLWSAVLYSQSLASKSQQKRLDLTWQSIEPRFTELTKDQQAIAEFNRKVGALDRFYTNRFLWGSTLNAFQQTMPANLADKIQVFHLTGIHDYQVTEAVPAKKKGTTVVEAAKPAAARERITITIEAKDYGNPADQNYNKFKNAIVSVPYFQRILPIDLVNLKSLSAPMRDPVENTDFIQFSLECKLPVVVRNE